MTDYVNLFGTRVPWNDGRGTPALNPQDAHTSAPDGYYLPAAYDIPDFADVDVEAALPAISAVLGPETNLKDWREAKPPEWVVEGVLQRGTVTAISAVGGSKKSLLAQTLYVELAAGGRLNWLGTFPVCEEDPLKVLVLDGECGRARLQRRLRELVEGNHFGEDSDLIADQATENLSLFAIDSIRDRGHALQALVWRLMINPVDVLVVDPLRVFMPAEVTDENNNLEMGRYLDFFVTLAKKLGVAVMLVAHDSKAGAVLRGASSQQNAVEILLHVTQPDAEDRNYLELRIEKDRDPAPEHFVAVKAECFAKTADGMRPIRFLDTEPRTGTGKVGSVVDQITAALSGAGGRMKQADLKATIGTDGGNYQRALNALKDSGAVEVKTLDGERYPHVFLR